MIKSQKKPDMFRYITEVVMLCQLKSCKLILWLIYDVILTI